MKKFKIKTGDEVVVLAGKDKGQKGRVLKIIKSKDRVIVEGVNVVKKHVKPSTENPQGGIEEKEAAIHISNVALVDPKTGKPTRVGYEIKDGNITVLVAPYISRVKLGTGPSISPLDKRETVLRSDYFVSDVKLIDSLINKVDFILVHHSHFEPFHVRLIFVLTSCFTAWLKYETGTELYNSGW